MGSSTNNFREYRDKSEQSSDYAQLPTNQAAILTMLAEPREMPYQVLCDKIKSLPEDQRLTQSQVDGALYELVKQGYLSSFMENGDIVYLMQHTPNKRPSKRDEQSLWNRFDIGLDALELDIDLPNLNRLKTPNMKNPPGEQKFNIPGLPDKKHPPTPMPPGIQRFNIPGISSEQDKTSPDDDEKEDDRRRGPAATI